MLIRSIERAEYTNVHLSSFFIFCLTCIGFFKNINLSENRIYNHYVYRSHYLIFKFIKIFLWIFDKIEMPGKLCKSAIAVYGTLKWNYLHFITFYSTFIKYAIYITNCNFYNFCELLSMYMNNLYTKTLLYSFPL